MGILAYRVSTKEWPPKISSMGAFNQNSWTLIMVFPILEGIAIGYSYSAWLL